MTQHSTSHHSIAQTAPHPPTSCSCSLSLGEALARPLLVSLLLELVDEDEEDEDEDEGWRVGVAAAPEGAEKRVAKVSAVSGLTLGGGRACVLGAPEQQHSMDGGIIIR
jgi:hypothetical protein